MKRAHKKSAAPFANAVLRKLTVANSAGVRDPETKTTISGNAAELSRELAHPLWLVERWIAEFGFDRASGVCEYDQHAPETAVRLANPEVETELKRAGVDLAPGILLASARRVRSGNVANTKAFAEGRVSIQDEASQLVGLLVGKGSRILDCCAAPGGKTRIVAAQNPAASIVALELHPHRARLLRKLVPAQNVEVIQSDVLEFAPEATFDRILADVPCSGTGTLAHNPEIKWRLSPPDLLDLQERQLAILKAAMRHAAPGARLVYSTCSLEREENELVHREGDGCRAVIPFDRRTGRVGAPRSGRRTGVERYRFSCERAVCENNSRGSRVRWVLRCNPRKKLNCGTSLINVGQPDEFESSNHEVHRGANLIFSPAAGTCETMMLAGDGAGDVRRRRRRSVRRHRR